MMKGFPHLPEDVAASIDAYDQAVTSGLLTFGTFPYDQPVITENTESTELM